MTANPLDIKPSIVVSPWTWQDHSQRFVRSYREWQEANIETLPGGHRVGIAAGYHTIVVALLECHADGRWGYSCGNFGTTRGRLQWVGDLDKAAQRATDRLRAAGLTLSGPDVPTPELGPDPFDLPPHPDDLLRSVDA